jgi:glucose/arabinose dehydrogenase
MYPSSPSSSWRVLGALILFLLVAATAAHAATLPAGFTESLVANGLSSPTAMAFAPDGRLFVTQQGGQLRVIKNGALLSTPFLTVTVSSSGERGLLGLAFDPNFATNQYIYVYYTATTPTLHNLVSRFTASGDTAVAGSEAIILELDNLSSATNHNGGALHFGPDGKLYIAVGENANSANSQTLSNLLGKILRINPDGSIPVDNPFYGTASGKNRAIWALGLRNPFTFSFQPGTSRMLINDVGQNTWEEINDGIAGSNYGWPSTEGPTSNSSFRGPIYWYGHGSGSTTGCAITGGTFYNPATQQFPAEYRGTYFFADFCSGWIRRIDPDTGNATAFATGISSPVDLRVTDDGSLYYLARGAGAVYRIRSTASQAPQITAHPSDRTVSVGGSATFTVSASGTAPLRYQWRRNGANISGAIAASYTLSSAAIADDGAVFDVVVSNDFGSATSNDATLTVTSNSAPTATITSPANRTLYRAGDTITYSGTGTDPENGTLPPSAFTWRVDFHHDTHNHPFVPETSGATGGSFTIPTTGETAANVWYRIHLTVRDAGGLTHSTFVDVVPRKATITLATEPAALRVTLDGQPFTAPHAVESVVGMVRTLGVVSPQTVGGITYVFESWSDGGAATHNISTPASNTTYIARFRATSGPLGLGLLGTYFDNADFTGAARTRLDPTVSFSWTGAPIAGIAGDTFSVRWTGQIKAQASGIHTFYTQSDDGVRLWVNGILLIDNWTLHGTTENQGTIELTAGQLYDLRMEFFENTGSAVAGLLWSAPGVTKQVVPQSQLYPYALLVAGSATLTSADAAVRNRLEASGYVPVVKAALPAVAADASGKAVVIVSSTVNPADVNTKFRTTIAPLVTWEARLFDDLGLTGPTAGADYGAAGNQTRLDIVNATHPLAAGLSGRVTVSTAPTIFDWGKPATGAIAIARLTGNANRLLIFGYERATPMIGLTAPARRVGFFLGDTAAGTLTAEGWSLFDAAVRWASGR